MLKDAREVPAGAAMDADVCVIGSGPAGLALALKLGHAGRPVLVLESGGLAQDVQSADLATPQADFHFGPETTVGVRRQVGGTANAWGIHTALTRQGVRLVRMNEADFEPRPLTPDGWPIRRADLSAFYDEAWAFFGLPGSDDPGPFESERLARLALDAEQVQTKMFRVADGASLLARHTAEVASSSNVRLLYNATALNFVTNLKCTRVEQAVVATAPGHVIAVKARQFVVAAGGLPTTQLLLRSAETTEHRLGGPADVLGRYFMDHPLVDGGDLYPSSRTLFDQSGLYDLRTMNGESVMAHLQLSERVLRTAHAANISVLLFPRARGYRASRALSPRGQRAVDAFNAVRGSRSFAAAAMPRQALNMLLGADAIGERALGALRHGDASLDRGGWSERGWPSQRYDSFQVLHQTEQLPCKQNRVTLGRERDALGERRLMIDWTWTDHDVEAVMRAQELYAAVFRDSGLGRFIPHRVEGRPCLLRASTAHFMGTTRMHDDPRRGVVDRDCKVHGIANLHVASTSVFPTGGFANPTLTVVALALRVADQLLRAVSGPGGE